LLQRLNDESAAERNQALVESGKEEEIEISQNSDACIMEKKRKHREDGESKTERNKKRKVDMNIEDKGPSSSNTQPKKVEMTVVQVKKAVIVPRHRAHRARAINAKNISSKSAAHIAEILGIAPTPSRSDSVEQLSEMPKGELTSLTDLVEIEKITTSTKSVADYFKEKLNARSSSAIVSTSTTPRRSDDSYDTPRMGLGSRTRLEDLMAAGKVEQEMQGLSLSTFSTFPSTLVYEKTPQDEDSASTTQIMNPEIKDTEKKKKKKKKAKNGEMEKEGSADEDNDNAKKREERKRKRKLDKGKKDSQDNLKELKEQEKRERKAEKLQVSVTSVDEEKPQKERKEKKKGSKSRGEHAEAYVS